MGNVQPHSSTISRACFGTLLCSTIIINSFDCSCLVVVKNFEVYFLLAITVSLGSWLIGFLPKLKVYVPDLGLLLRSSNAPHSFLFIFHFGLILHHEKSVDCIILALLMEFFAVIEA